MPPPRRVIDQRLYSALVQAFTDIPGDISNAARATGTTRPTARKAFQEGWPSKGWPPIQQVLSEARDEARAGRARSTLDAEEQAAKLLADAKARAQELLDAADKGVLSKREQAEAEYKLRLEKAERDAKAKVDTLLNASRLDAAETMRKEALLSLSARNTALSAFGLGAKVLAPQNIQALGDRLVTALTTGKPLNVRQASRLMRDVGIFTRSLVAVGEAAIVIERKRVGAPEATLAVQGASGADMSVEDADIMLQALQNAVARAKQGQEGESPTEPPAEPPAGAEEAEDVLH